MRRSFFLWVGVLAALLMVAAGCGGGGDKGSATSTAAAGKTATAAAGTTAVATSPAGTSVSKAELANDLTTIKAVMQDTIAKAQAGDVEGTREAEGKGDEAIEAIIKALGKRFRTGFDNPRSRRGASDSAPYSTSNSVTP